MSYDAILITFNEARTSKGTYRSVVCITPQALKGSLVFAECWKDGIVLSFVFNNPTTSFTITIAKGKITSDPWNA
jgi:hypothetical protein